MLVGVLPHVSITCANPLLTGPMKYCNYCDVTSISQFELVEIVRPFLLRPGNEAKHGTNRSIS